MSLGDLWLTRDVNRARPFGRVCSFASPGCELTGSGGRSVRQESIPNYFREKYGVSNLYRMDLAAFHRSFYTIANRSIILLDIVDHP